MKAYTDLSQSKKLADILPIESADMYFYDKDAFTGALSAFNGGVLIRRDLNNEFPNKTTPTWSLAALIDILPEDIIGQRHYFFEISKMGDASTPHEVRYYRFREESDGGDFGRITWISYQANNLVDACVEMILKLHELKML